MRHIRVHTGEKPFKVNAFWKELIDDNTLKNNFTYIFFLCSVLSATGHSRKRVRYKFIHGNIKVFGRILAASVTPSSVKKVWGN